MTPTMMMMEIFTILSAMEGERKEKEKTSVGLNQQVAIFKIQYNTQFHVRIQFEFFCSVPPNLILFCDIF